MTHYYLITTSDRIQTKSQLNTRHILITLVIIQNIMNECKYYCPTSNNIHQHPSTSKNIQQNPNITLSENSLPAISISYHRYHHFPGKHAINAVFHQHPKYHPNLVGYIKKHFPSTLNLPLNLPLNHHEHPKIISRKKSDPRDRRAAGIELVKSIGLEPGA